MADYKIDYASLGKYLYTKVSPLGREMRKRGQMMESVAKSKVGVKTGNLRQSIKMEHKVSPFGQTIELTATAPHAIAHHDGTKPHLITPKDPRGVLRFQKSGVIVFAHKVMHPGNKPNPFLRDALYQVNSDLLG